MTKHSLGNLVMVGQESRFQPKLFYHQINLTQRVPESHLPRKIQEQIDFDFIDQEKEISRPEVLPLLQDY